MPIKVATKYITSEEIQAIIQNYNYNKPTTEPSIEYLQCSEGGFKLYIGIHEFNKKYKRYGGYTRNGPVKQLRWNRNILVSYYNYPGFSPDEELRLFRAMCDILGRENVEYYETFSSALRLLVEERSSGDKRMDVEGRSSDEVWTHVDFWQKSGAPESKVAMEDNYQCAKMEVLVRAPSLVSCGGYSFPRVRL